MIRRISALASALFVLALTATGTTAQEAGKSLAADGQMTLMQAATDTMRMITEFHDALLILITVITLFVFALLAIIVVRFNRKRNPTPSKTSHNTLLEVVWTVIPIVILVVIAFPSFRLLYHQDVVPESDFVIRATGHQWFWSYEYPDHGGIAFDALMLPAEFFDNDLSPDVQQQRLEAQQYLADFLGQDELPEIHRLLDTDTRIVVPVGATVKLQVTASDVLHSWTIPAFGLKMDAVPGRFNESWFRAEEVGTFYGQCSELCGIRHAFMPIVVEVVTSEQFERWVAMAQERFADATPGSNSIVRVADATLAQQ